MDRTSESTLELFQLGIIPEPSACKETGYKQIQKRREYENKDLLNKENYFSLSLSLSLRLQKLSSNMRSLM